jgi:hypothetical protein
MSRKTLSQDSNSEFHRRKLKWTNQFVEDNIDIIESNYSKFPNRNRWNCNCHVIHDDDFDVQHIDYPLLREKYEKVVDDFCRKQNLRLSHLSDLWYNYYKRGQYQEPHTHDGPVGKSFTAVHYMIFDHKHHSETKFIDSDIVAPKVKQGHILFFPSNWTHYVPYNQTTIPRLTVAFTFICY